MNPLPGTAFDRFIVSGSTRLTMDSFCSPSRRFDAAPLLPAHQCGGHTGIDHDPAKPGLDQDRIIHPQSDRCLRDEAVASCGMQGHEHLDQQADGPQWARTSWVWAVKQAAKCSRRDAT